MDDLFRETLKGINDEYNKKYPNTYFGANYSDNSLSGFTAQDEDALKHGLVGRDIFTYDYGKDTFMRAGLPESLSGILSSIYTPFLNSQIGRQTLNFSRGVTDTVASGLLNVPGLISGGIGKASEGLFGGNSIFTDASKKLFDWDNEYKKLSDTIAKGVVGTDPTFWDNVFHGAGTSLGFMAAGTGAGAFAKSMLHVSPFLADVIGFGTQNLLESLTEAGNAASDTYATDKSRHSDALWAGLYSLGTNALSDAGQSFLEGYLTRGLNKILPTKGGALRQLFTEGLKHIAGEELNELLQEPRQQAVEQAVMNTFNSGDMSLANLGYNLGKEASHIFKPHADANGNVIPSYWDQVSKETAMSTLLTSLLTLPLGFNFGQVLRNSRKQRAFNRALDARDTTQPSPEMVAYRADDEQRFNNAYSKAKEAYENSQDTIDRIIYADHSEDYDPDSTTLQELQKAYDDRDQAKDFMDRAWERDSKGVSTNPPPSEDIDLYPDRNIINANPTQNVTNDSSVVHATEDNAPVSNAAVQTQPDNTSDVQDEPDDWLDSALNDSAGNSDTLSQSANSSDDDAHVGNFTFRTTGHSHSFNVSASEAALTGNVSNDRLKRMRGLRSLSISANNGRTIATYHPNSGSFQFNRDFERKHSARWLNGLRSAFSSKLNEFLNAAAWLDDNGNLLHDGNEDFRNRWNDRFNREGNEGRNAFYSNDAQQEDFDNNANTTLNTATPNTAPNIANDAVAPSLYPNSSNLYPNSSKRNNLRGAVSGVSAMVNHALGLNDDGTEAYNQSTIDDNPPHFNVYSGEQKREFSVKRGDFSDAFPEHQKYVGSFLEIFDENGNSVARYSPYTGKLQMADNSQELMHQVKAVLQKGMSRFLASTGFIDENTGRLIKDGNDDYRHQYITRADTTPKGKEIHPNHFKKSKPIKDSRSWFRRFLDSRAERKAFKHVKKEIKKKIQALFDDVLKSAKDNDAIPDGLLPTESAEYYATIYAARLRAAAHVSGLSIEDMFKLWNLKFSFELQDEYRNRGNIVVGQAEKLIKLYGHIEELNLYKHDDNGNIVRDADGKPIVKKTQKVLVFDADPSTLLHEGAHLFLDDIKDIMKLPNISDNTRKEWLTLTQWLGVADIDLTLDKKYWTQEQRDRWIYAQEKFASAAEQYFLTGHAPESWLKQAFTLFKRWMLRVYDSVKEIKFTAATEDSNTEGLPHELELSPEIKTFFDNLFKDTEFIPNEENRKARFEIAGQTSQQEEHFQSSNDTNDRVDKEYSSKQRIRRTNDTFISQRDIERFEQLAYHGSGHIILNNKFDLAYLGSGEGNQAFGWGLYFAQNKAVAENFREAGLDNSDATLAFSLSNGLSFSDFKLSQLFSNLNSDNPQFSGLPDNVTPQGLFEAIKDLSYRFSENYDTWNFKAHKKSLLREYKELAKQLRSQGRNNRLRSVNQAIDALKALNNLDFHNYKKGNIYEVDIPESYTLLDFNAPLAQQSEHVKKAIQKVLKKLSDTYHLSQSAVDAIAASEYGEDFYRALSDALRDLVNTGKLSSNKLGKISSPDMAASLILNQAGIPGSQYWDKGSRYDKSGTRNFVIWNTDLITLLGLDDTSDSEAKDYFNTHKNNNSESYNQSIRDDDDFAATPDAQIQLDDVRKQYEGTPKWLKAPNGKPTNLTEHQWLQVRTSNFKNWFGDWENDPQNASKILDANGEPLVVYHGTNALDIKTFKRSIKGWLGPGIYFTPYKQYAEVYKRGKPGTVMGLFMNMRNPMLVNTTNPIIEILTRLYGDNAQKIFNQRYQEIQKREFGDFYKRLNEGKILSQIEQNFDRVIKRYILSDDEIKSVLAQGNYDGIAWHDDDELNELMADPNYDGTYYYNTEFSVQNPAQVKSATHNNGEFNPDKGDIYKQSVHTLNLPFNPNELKTESGSSIHNAKSSELILTPDGSTALSYIDDYIAKAAGIQEGEIQANVGVLRHAENQHGEQIRNAGYPNVQTFLLDVLHNWSDIRESSNDSFWLVAPKDDGHGSVAAIRLHQNKNGVYRVATLIFARERTINSKRLIFAGRPSPASSSSSGKNLTRAASFYAGTSAAKGGLSEEQSLLISLNSQNSNVNHESSDSYNVNNSVASQRITSDNDLTPEVQFPHARNNDSFTVRDKNNNPNNNETYNQNVRDAENLLTPDAQKQVDALRDKYKDTNLWLKAPNGKKSNLDEFHWLLVRTHNFKQWFGDWENNPDSASKALDDNGEPLILTHISRNGGGFSVFNTQGDFTTDYGQKTKNTGAWFADLKGNENVSLETAGIYSPVEGQNIYHVFLNLRNPFIYDAQGKRWQRVGNVWIHDNKTGDNIYHNDAGKAFSNLSWANGYIREHLNNDYDRYSVQHDPYQTSDDLVRSVRNGDVGNGNHDGVIIKNLRDMSVWGVDDYIIFDDTQVKSTSNNGSFSTKTNEIYMQSANDDYSNNSLSTFSKYSDILEASNPNDINFDNLRTPHDGFISDKTIEKFNQQDTWHGTGHIIENNKFDLSKVGTGEGGKYRGWGIYTAQAKGVGQTYRKFGLSKVISFHTPDGKSFSFRNGHWFNKPDNPALAAVFDDFVAAFYDKEYDDPYYCLGDLYEQYHSNIASIETKYLIQHIEQLENFLKTGEPKSYSEERVRKSLPELQKRLKELENYKKENQEKIDAMELFDEDELKINVNTKGNLYIAGVQDNDVLLDWDAKISEQPEHVKKAIEKIRHFILKWSRISGFNPSAFLTSDTGGSLYMNIVDIMKEYISKHKPKDGVNDAKQRTSLLFNRFGIPALRFLDRFSRYDTSGKHETWNFVTWNEDAIELLGIDPSSDQDAIDYFNRIEQEQHSFNPDNETYSQIGLKRKNDMDSALARSRPDLTKEQRTEAINEIEKLGESVRQGGNPKVEKLATHWLLHGHVILPEDNYKILDAIRICEQRHLDPMQFDDPNEILAKYTIKERRIDLRINPDSVPEFSHKVQHDNGITVYTVEDSEEGQRAVRSIIDTHWGKDANPWCLAARDENEDDEYYENGELDRAWGFWESYDGTPKRIAFKDGRLLAFSASNIRRITWWDREDNPFEDIPYRVKENGNVYEYLYNELNRESIKLKETLSNGTIHQWFDNGKPQYEKLPDGTEHRYHDNGQLKYEVLPDGTKRLWYRDEQIESPYSHDGTLLWDKKGRQLERETLPDGTERKWYRDGKLLFEKLPDGTEREWHGNGQICSEKLPDGTSRSWFEDGQLKYEKLADGTERSYYENGNIKGEQLPNGTLRTFDENGQLKREIETYHQTFKQNDADYLNEYKRTHPDGFITADALEHFDQLHTHATGHIILDNHFDLKYVGTGEGGAMFGHGIYLEESPEVAETYRTYGLPNRGRGTLNIHTVDRITYSFDGDNWKRSDGKDIDDIDIKQALNSYSIYALTPPHIQQMNHLDIQDALISDFRKELKEAKRNSKREQNSDFWQKRAIHLQRQLDFIYSLKGYEFTNQKKGNVYLVDIPENYELLDWDKSLKNQPQDVLNKLQNTIDTINNNPVILVAKRFAALAHNPKSAEKSLLRILQSLTSPEHKGRYLYERDLAALPEFKTVKRLIMPSKKRDISIQDNIDEFHSAINSLNRIQNIYALKPSATGGDLYHTLTDLLGSKEAASMYLNSIGIPGHRYFDRVSRAKSKGTHNFVIWNMNRLHIVGLEGDEDAVNYFRDTALQKLTGNPDEHYEQSESSHNNFISDEQFERFNQPMWHGTRHILEGNRFDLAYLSSGEGGQMFGYGIYLAENPEVAKSYRKSGMRNIDFDNTVFIFAHGKEIGSNDWAIKISKAFDNLPRGIKDLANPFSLAGMLSDIAHNKNSDKYSSINEAVDYFINSVIQRSDAGKAKFPSEYDKSLIAEYKDTLQNIITPLLPDSIKAKTPSNGNIYSVEGPEDFELLNWDAPMSQQSEQVLNALKRNGLYLNDNETGEQLYRRLQNQFGGQKKGEKLAAMALNDAGIPGHRFWDRGSRDDKSGTHNFVIWNTDTLRLMGISDDSDQDAQDYYRAEDYSNAYLDSLDNDSDMRNYSDVDYGYDMGHIDDLANAHSDSLDSFSDYESYSQAHIFSPSQLEHFDQLAYTGTGHIIIGNRFDLKFIGSNEGSAVFGYGAYLAENVRVAQHYRHYGLNGVDDINKPNISLSISTSDGKTYSFPDDNMLTPEHILDVMEQLARFFEVYPRSTTKQALDSIRESFEASIKRNSTRHSEKAKLISQELQKNIDVLDSIQDIFDIKNIDRNGNIYIFDIPENYELLDWDATLEKQPEKVKDAISRVWDALNDMGYSKEKVKEINEVYNFTSDINTGADFYRAIEAVMEQWLALNPNPKDNITRADARASMLLNKFGIPGHRYWDGRSRAKQKGTHNFVIWDTSRMTMQGLTDDSDIDAIEYFNHYKETHPDGFIPKNEIQQFEQLVTHATGHIILDNKFDLLYVGSGEGNAAFGHGIYFEQNPRVAEYYRRYGLKNGGRGDIHITTRDGSTFNNTDYHSWDNSPNDNISDLLSQLEDAIRDDSISGYKPNFSKIKRELVKSLKSDLAILNEKLNDGRNQLDTMKNGTDDYSDLQHSLMIAQNAADNIKEKINFLKSIKSFSLDPDKKGNVYTADIPEDYELLDWNATLDEQPEPIKQIIRDILLDINHNRDSFSFSAKGIAKKFARHAPNNKNAQNNIARIVKSIMLNRHEIIRDSYDFRSLPQYRSLARLFKGNEFVLDSIRTDINKLIHFKRLSPLNSQINKGEDLYHALEAHLGSDEEASDYLNKKGIPGLRYWDSYSRHKKSGTHNFVIWNMNRISLLGLEGDKQAVDYFRDTALQKLTGNPDEHYSHNDASHSESESYNQIIGEKGARHLDAANSNTELINNLNVAKIMDARNFDRDKIWFATGWMRGIDGQWKREIPDGKLKSEKEIKHAFSSFIRQYLSPKVQQAMQNSGYKPIFSYNHVKLSDIFDAPELYKAYPKLKNFTVDAAPLPQSFYAITNPVSVLFNNNLDSQIVININHFNNYFNHDDLQKAILHEIQHVIQLIEGFAYGNSMSAEARAKFNDIIGIIRDYGGNFKYQLLAIINALQDKNIKTAKNIAYSLPKEIRPVAAKVIRDFAGFLEAAEDYEFSAGEAEARNVVNREHLTPEQRRHTPLYKTSDVREEKQIPTYIHVSDDAESDLLGKPESYDQSAEAEQLKAVRKKYKGTSQWLKAPNGQDTQLTEKQWLQVRTPNFKEWFGDWENDPENSSKVLDDNGEPLIVYHRTKRGNHHFSVFNIDSQGSHFGSREQADNRAKGKLYPVFLNIRNPRRTSDQGFTWKSVVRDAKLYDFDGLVYANEFEGEGDSWVAFYPEQIKSATKNSGEFNSSNPDIYHQLIGSIGAFRLDSAENSSARIDALIAAQQAEKEGLSPKRIWLAFGWSKGADGQWRYELPDGKLKDNYKRILRKASIDRTKLADFFNAPEIFNAYPELKDLRIGLRMDNSSKARYSPKDNAVFVSFPFLISANDSEIRSTLIHEIQHAVQNIEGFSLGIPSGHDRIKIFYEKVNDILRNANHETKDIIYAYAEAVKDNLDDKAQYIYDNAKREAKSAISKVIAAYNKFSKSYDDYIRDSWEVEARNADKRSNMSFWERILHSPLDTEDTPRDKQTFGLPETYHQIIGSEGAKRLDTLENSSENNHFISPQQIEQFNQLYYHGTDNIIRGNKFDLNFAGSSEGTAMYAYGAYVAENINVAQSYRHFGDPYMGNLRVTIQTNDGSVFHSVGKGRWNRHLNYALRSVLDDLYSLAEHDENHNLEQMKNDILKSYRTELREHKRVLAQIKQSGDIHGDDIKLRQNYIDNTNRKIDALKSVYSLSVLPPKNGNIYSFEGPDADVLLDWDKSMLRQPEVVRQARKEILEELKFWGFDITDVKKAKTGEDFYRSIVLLMKSVDSNFAYPDKGISDPKQRASLILNLHGIHGTRYLDSLSRENPRKKNATHNAVIWNTETLAMLGITPDSNPDAIQHFNSVREKQEQNQEQNSESYNQLIGEKGTRTIDEANDNTELIDNNHEEFLQHNPFVSRSDYPFNNPESEKAFNDSRKGIQHDKSAKGLKHYLLTALHGFNGDFPELAGADAKAKGLTYAREILRMLKRKADAQTTMAVYSLARSLDKLNKKQFEIFTRILLINDIFNFKRKNPNAPLPLGFTNEALQSESQRFLKLAKADKDIWIAVNSEHKLNNHIKNQLVTLAQELGLKNLANRIKNNPFDSAMIDYANIISPNSPDINANYIQAMGELRISQLQDIVKLQAIKEIKDNYDIKDKLVKQFGSLWGLHIPNGYKSWNILAHNFIEAANSLHENILSSALELTAQQLGLSDETLHDIRQSMNEKDNSHLLVLPVELVNTLNYMLKPKHRGPWTQLLKKLSTSWKKFTLFFPTRTIKYNIRNFTGDLDAVLAGNPKALRFMKRAVSELYTAFYGDYHNIAPELIEFQKRGGALTAESAHDLYDYRKLKEFNHLISKIDDKTSDSWMSLPKKFWEMTDALLWSGVQKASNFREGWLRYACYLDFLDQMMHNPNGEPNNWGASDPHEVMSIPDIRDRAFKMANELLGAYDQVSEAGQALRDLFIPFYSWM